MNRSREALDELMQRVLEGEAASAEQRELEAELVRDPAARARFDAQRLAFERLSKLALPEAPATLHASVMAQVRSAHAADTRLASTAPHRAAGGDLRRWAFPAVAGVVALLLLWFTSGPRPGGPLREQAAGAMGQARGAGRAVLGEGAATLHVHWERMRGGFELRLEAGAEPVELELTALTPGSSLRGAMQVGLDVAPGAVLHLSLPAHHRESYVGVASTPDASVKIVARFAGGRTVEREITFTGLQDAAPGPSGPTSAPPAGH